MPSITEPFTFPPGICEFSGQAGVNGFVAIIAYRVQINGQSTFRWDTTGEYPHWEQAFSTDDGDSWETNWTMDFTRM